MVPVLADYVYNGILVLQSAVSVSFNDHARERTNIEENLKAFNGRQSQIRVKRENGDFIVNFLVYVSQYK